MKGDNIEINGQGVVYSNNIISVTNGGTFIFSGNLNDGQIYINNEELTHIIFNGVDIIRLLHRYLLKMQIKQS